MQNLEGLETFLAYNTNYKNLENYNKISSSYGSNKKENIIEFIICFFN